MPALAQAALILAVAMASVAAAVPEQQAAAAPERQAAPPPLPALSIDAGGISISGLSSGADFVVQFQVAFSSIVSGVGVFAGQPYHCAVTRFPADRLVPFCTGTHVSGDMNTTVLPAPGSARAGCTGDHPSPDVPYCPGCPAGKTLLYDHCKRWPEIVDIELLLSYAREQAAEGTIDPLSNFKGKPVFLYRGTKDTCYLKGSLANSQRFFEKLGANVLFNSTTPSAHAWPTKSFGPPCGSGVIEACDYDGPGAALQHIYANNLRPPVDAPNRSMSLFGQAPFMTTDNNGTARWNETMPMVTGLAPAGHVYVPAKCKLAGAKCKLHFSLHGCGVNEYYDEAVHHLGFQRWGEANGIVIVFPRIQPHGGTTETVSGCWDGYAQHGADYALKSGPQMHAMRQMIKAVAGL